MVAQRPLEPPVQVRILAPQPHPGARPPYIRWSTMDWEPEHGPGRSRLVLLEMAQRRARSADAEAHHGLVERDPEKDPLESLKILTGTANPDLAQRICAQLGVEVGQATIGQF